MPRIDFILESALTVADLERSLGFYQALFGFEVMTKDHRLAALAVGKQVLLLFRRGTTAEPAQTSGGIIPGHESSGRAHLAFAIANAEQTSWEARLGERGIAIESQVDWPRGGRSIYFRDPDGHLLELATPGIWANF
jgi:catechol 2,3-dioxygenase-like lactoylglutathione lyase family enzyme